MLVKIKKLWLGHASVRDSVVKSCITKGEDLYIDLMGEVKKYPWDSLEDYLKNTSNTTFTSKFNGRQYKLIDFPWKGVSYGSEQQSLQY